MTEHILVPTPWSQSFLPPGSAASPASPVRALRVGLDAASHPPRSSVRGRGGGAELPAPGNRAEPCTRALRQRGLDTPPTVLDQRASCDGTWPEMEATTEKSCATHESVTEACVSHAGSLERCFQRQAASELPGAPACSHGQVPGPRPGAR